MFGFFSNKIPVAAIQKGKHLKKAIEKDVDTFLECRLHNPPRKAMVGIWLILFEDSEWIYWGYPKFRMIFSDSRVVDEFFRTDKKKLKEIYPQYAEDFRSVSIRLKLREEILKFESAKDGILIRDFYLDPNYEIKATDHKFVIRAKGDLSYTAAPYTDQAREEKQKRTYTVTLKMDDLGLLEIS